MRSRERHDVLLPLRFRSFLDPRNRLSCHMLHEDKEREGQQRQKARGRERGGPRDMPRLKRSWKVTKQRDFAKQNLHMRSVNVSRLESSKLRGQVRTKILGDKMNCTHRFSQLIFCESAAWHNAAWLVH